MTVSQKILCSFLLSAILCAGFASLVFTGVLNNYREIVGGSMEILLYVTVFLILFFIIFLFFNLRRKFASAVAEKVVPDAGLGGSFYMFRQPFAFIPGNPKLLQEAKDQNPCFSGETVYEKNGIHYINSNVFTDNEKEEILDRNFVNLVESVVNNEEFELT